MMMVHGLCQVNMSQILKELGIDEEDVRWYHIAACKNMSINWFYDDYENDKVLAATTDLVCLNCPVIKQCYREGVQNKEKGVWGGIFMDLGRVDKENNLHKTKEIWSRLKKIHGKNLL
jgi:hypothetical protein